MIQHLNENKYHPTNNIEGTGLKHYDCERFSSMVHSLIPENIQKVLLLMFVVVNFFFRQNSRNDVIIVSHVSSQQLKPINNFSFVSLYLVLS